MEPHSVAISIAMLKEVIGGKTYDAVAAQYGVSRTAVERRIKSVAVKVAGQIGIPGVSEGGVIYVQKLRKHSQPIMTALERYEPQIAHNRRVERVLTDDDIRCAVQRTRLRSRCPSRDVALLYVLLTNGARPLEIARLEVRDYLNADGTVRGESVLRAEAAINGKVRPLFFISAKAKAAIDEYLAERLQRRFGICARAVFRGLDPDSRLFLTETGAPFEIVGYPGASERRFLCRGIHDTYRKIFRRIGFPGITPLTVRRTVATRLFERGAADKQIGQVLGISDMRAVRDLIPKLAPSLPAVVGDLV